MSPLEAVFGVAALVALIHHLVIRQLDRLGDPAYLRTQGVVIVREEVLQSRSDSIGEFRGHPIWGGVTFMGMHYRFDHVIEDRKREQLGAGELYLAPGLVYVLK